MDMRGKHRISEIMYYSVVCHKLSPIKHIAIGILISLL